MLDKRREHRLLTLKTGTIISIEVPSGVDCAILDLTVGGACLLVPIGAEIPDTFDLAIDPSRASYACKVAWKSGNKIGVSFQSRSAA